MSFPSFASGDVLTAADMNAVGLWLVKTQTVGAGVSSVTVTGAFSADYDNYKIVYSGGNASADGDLRLTLGSTATGYHLAFGFTAYTGAGSNAGVNNGTSFTFAGSHRTTVNSLGVELLGPFLTDETVLGGFYMGAKAGSGGGVLSGFLNDTSSYTAFTLTPSSGTLTGGTIRVYGYRN